MDNFQASDMQRNSGTLTSKKQDMEKLKVKEATLNVEIYDIRQEATVQSHNP
jgi:hypothetical protein